MDWLVNEAKSAGLLVVGLVMLGVGMLVSDAVTGLTGKLWKRRGD